MTVPAPAKRLLDFIASFEAPRGYDTVFANRMAQMPKPITSMTVDEVIAQGKWRTDTFGSSACGRYQFMKNTLIGLKASQRLTGREVMTPDLQDRLGYALLLGRGYARFMAGELSQTAFGNEIAKEWASFPVLSAIDGKRRGQSYYAGDGLMARVIAGEYHVTDLTETVRLGLIGGGATPTEAATLARVYVAERPLSERHVLANRALFAAWNGTAETSSDPVSPEMLADSGEVILTAPGATPMRVENDGSLTPVRQGRGGRYVPLEPAP